MRVFIAIALGFIVAMVVIALEYDACETHGGRLVRGYKGYGAPVCVDGHGRPLEW